MYEHEHSDGLVEKIIGKGIITAKDLKEELSKKDINFTELYSKPYGWLLFFIGLIWLLPFIGQYAGWAFLGFFARLPRVEFPLTVILIGAFLFAAAILLEIKISLIRKKAGGCEDTHETVIIIREGPYKIIRHPGHLAEMIYFSLLPVLLGRWIPFTITAAGSIVMLIAGFIYMIKDEDRFNTRKWGDEYRKYIDDVPAINFIKGLSRQKR